ncbi:MAG: phosphoenolpyruvate--protein phosphotransferase, partial [Candidatus Aminicenantes bacterium]|nr:phosphoenolpyruvate--protein phosphotransferase [Candidatus Aminicenantes bacterium]
MEFIRLRGIGVSPGIAMGEAVLTERIIFTSRKEDISPQEVGAEILRLAAAVARTKAELIEIKEKIREKVGAEHAYIFEAHLL